MLLTVKDVCKSYGSHIALDSISFELREGTICGLLGPNGAGKTSLLRIITGILQPDKGRVQIQGKPVSQEKAGYLPEEKGLYRKMKTLELLKFFGTLKGMNSGDAVAAAAKHLEEFGLGTWAEKKVEQLSKGMQQKVQFLAAILHGPSLLILDEPFSGLDPVNADFLTREIIKMKQKGCGIILSTHRMDNVEMLCDHLLMINRGKLLLNDSVDRIKNQHQQKVWNIRYSGQLLAKPATYNVVAENRHEEKSMITISAKDNFTASDILQEMVSQVAVEEFSPKVTSLNDIFLDLVEQ